jgi:hypothetical protein
VRVGNAGQDRHDLPVRLLVHLGALGLVSLGPRLFQELLDVVQLVAVRGAPLLLRGAEEDADEVVRIPEVTRPAEQVDLQLALV